jgi:hypothetical protein
MFMKTKDKNGRAIVYRESGQILEIYQGDLKQPMLCEDCEQMLSTQYEVFLNDVLYLRRKAKLYYAGEDLIVLEADSDRAALSLITIFWRAAVSNLDEFENAAAPEDLLEALRGWIKSGEIDPNWDKLVSIKLTEVMLRQGQTMYIFIPPFIDDRGDYFVFNFMCGGFLISFSLPAAYPDRGKIKFLSAKSGSIWIDRINFNEIPAIKESIVKMMSTTVPEKIALLASKSGSLKARRKKIQ